MAGEGKRTRPAILMACIAGLVAFSQTPLGEDLYKRFVQPAVHSTIGSPDDDPDPHPGSDKDLPVAPKPKDNDVETVVPSKGAGEKTSTAAAATGETGWLYHQSRYVVCAGEAEGRVGIHHQPNRAPDAATVYPDGGNALVLQLGKEYVPLVGRCELAIVQVRRLPRSVRLKWRTGE